MRALIIGPDEKAAITSVVNYATEPDHYYRYGSKDIPGSNPSHIAHIPDGFRCVYSVTEHDGKLWRHLSVSVPKQSMYPSPEAAVTLAREFGFTSSDDGLNIIARMEHDGWLVSQGHHGENCIVMAQPLVEDGKYDS